MTTVQIEIPDQQAAVLRAHAQARGLTVEQWLIRMIEQAGISPSEQKSADTRPVWEIIEDSMKEVPPEDLAALPKDGAAQLDHYVYGLPKRNM